jgi:hypothetical protein
LNEGLAFGRRLTLVSAPAGFGKTICISEWVNGLDCPVAQTRSHCYKRLVPWPLHVDELVGDRCGGHLTHS